MTGGTTKGLWVWIGALLLLSTTQVYGQADDAAQCSEEGETLSLSRYLRALSLDLRGGLPTMAEYAQVEAAGEVPRELIEEMLQSDAFAWQFVEFHKTLLWPYIRTTVPTTTRQMGPDAGNPWGSGTFVWYRGSDSASIRGRGGVFCRDEPEPDPENIRPVEMADGTLREGYVCVRPYYRHIYSGLGNRGDCPPGELKVCAFDAQIHRVSPRTGVRCDLRRNSGDPGCGCGPNMQWCGHYQQFVEPVFASFLRQIRWVLDHDRPYFEMLTRAPPMVNGPMAHYYRHTLPYISDPDRGSLTINPALVPEMDYEEDIDRWVPLDVGGHARGILTHPLFLYRFMTNRARSDRYFNAFLCQPFDAPDGGIDLSGEPHPDLQEQEGCKYCHSVIEPTAAHWGRYSQGGAAYLDPANFPDFDPVCLRCAVTGQCERRCINHYIISTPTGTEAPWLGYLRAYLYRRDDHVPNINAGPALLVQRGLADGRVARCAAKNAVVWLTGREPKPDERSWIASLATDFGAANYDYRQLVMAIVTSDFYRRAR